MLVRSVPLCPIRPPWRSHLIKYAATLLAHRSRGATTSIERSLALTASTGGLEGAYAIKAAPAAPVTGNMFVRFGLISGLALIGAAIWTYFSYPPLKTAQSSPVKRAQSTPASAVPVAPSKAIVPSDADLSNSLGGNDDLVATEKMMIPPPPGADPALQGINPRRLSASFKRGMGALAMQGNFDEETTSQGARLVSIAAILGYEPARAVIARDYPRSPIIRATVSRLEAVRYSLDPLLIAGSQSESNRTFLALLASYFSGRHELEAYATDLLAALGDDRRLQTADSLQALFLQLARVPGACKALARAVVKMPVTESGCTSTLQQQIENYIRVTEPIGREAQSRREALQLLERPKDAQHSTAR